VDIGAKAIYTTGALLLINLAAIIIFYKELKLATFDPMLAAVLGFAPALLHYGLMTIVSLTTVAAFQAVGSILVVAFMVGPPVTAYLLTDDLKHMLILSGLIGAINGVLGYQAAALLDVSIAGSIAVTTGLVFLLVFILAPARGLVSSLYKRRQQKIQFAEMALLFHLYNHEGSEIEAREAGVQTIQTHMRWAETFTNNILARLIKDGSIQIENQIIKLTDYGRQVSIQKYEELFAQ